VSQSGEDSIFADRRAVDDIESQDRSGRRIDGAAVSRWGRSRAVGGFRKGLTSLNIPGSVDFFLYLE